MLMQDSHSPRGPSLALLWDQWCQYPKSKPGQCWAPMRAPCAHPSENRCSQPNPHLSKFGGEPSPCIWYQKKTMSQSLIHSGGILCTGQGLVNQGTNFFYRLEKIKHVNNSEKTNIVTTIIYNQWINGCFTVRPQWPKGLFKRIKPRYCSEVWALWVERLLEMPRADTLTGGSSPWSELQGAAPFLTQTPSSWCSAGMGTHSEQPQMQEGHLTAGRVQIHTELCALGGGACGHTRWWTQSSLVPRTLALVAQSSPWG